MALVLVSFQDNDLGVEVQIRGSEPVGDDDSLTPAQVLAALAVNAAFQELHDEEPEE